MFEILDQHRYFRSMPVRPIWLGQEIVNEIDPARTKQRERLLEMREFAWPRVRVGSNRSDSSALAE